MLECRGRLVVRGDIGGDESTGSKKGVINICYEKVVGSEGLVM